jgi:hypothetical protein
MPVMTRTIPGTLDPRMLHFQTLDRQQQAEAIRRLVATGMSELAVAQASGLAVEQVRRILAERGTP